MKSTYFIFSAFLWKKYFQTLSLMAHGRSSDQLLIVANITNLEGSCFHLTSFFFFTLLTWCKFLTHNVLSVHDVMNCIKTRCLPLLQTQVLQQGHLQDLLICQNFQDFQDRFLTQKKSSWTNKPQSKPWKSHSQSQLKTCRCSMIGCYVALKSVALSSWFLSFSDYVFSISWFVLMCQLSISWFRYKLHDFLAEHLLW